MGNSFWRRIETSPSYRRKKRALKRLLGKELRLKTEVVVPLIKDGDWCYTPEGLNRQSVVYSLGVGDDIGLDLTLIENHGVELHAFDPTPFAIDMLAGRELPRQFQFHPWAVTARDGNLTFYPRLKSDGTKSDVMYTMIAEDATREDGIEVPAFTLDSIAARLGHERIDLLKMDIEGAEYEVLEGLIDSPIAPRQLLVEFHHRFPGIGLQKTAATIDRLRAAGYRIIAVSEIGREVSFLRP